MAVAPPCAACVKSLELVVALVVVLLNTGVALDGGVLAVAVLLVAVDVDHVLRGPLGLLILPLRRVRSMWALPCAWAWAWA